MVIGGKTVSVTGILSSGGSEEDAVIAPIAFVQDLIGRPGAVRRVYVSALTKPEDEFGRRDPRSMSGETLERWMCSPYANTIAHQISLAIPNAKAEQIRAVAQNEGQLLSRISLLMWTIALGGLAAAGLAVASATATTLIERKPEIALLRCLGAGNGSISGLFLAEGCVLATVGGLVGFVAGSWLARSMSMTIFGSAGSFRPQLIPILLLVALIVALLGAAPSIRRAVRLHPSLVLRGDLG